MHLPSIIAILSCAYSDIATSQATAYAISESTDSGKDQVANWMHFENCSLAAEQNERPVIREAGSLS